MLLVPEFRRVPSDQQPYIQALYTKLKELDMITVAPPPPLSKSQCSL